MYYLKKTLEVSGSHRLCLDYESKCQNVHGHNWIITVHCRRKDLDRNGMILDFSHIKEQVMGAFDHQHLNDSPLLKDQNPTAENIAKIICTSLAYCYKVEVQESSGNTVTYEQD